MKSIVAVEWKLWPMMSRMNLTIQTQPGELFSQSDSPRMQVRKGDRSESTVIGEIPVEFFDIPPSAAIIPGLKPAKDKGVGASARRKAKYHNTRSSHEAKVPWTTSQIDARKLKASAYVLDVEEPSIRMPKLPFASRLALDTHEGSHLANTGGDKRSRSAPHPRIGSRGKSTEHSQEVSNVSYPIDFETRLPPFLQTTKIPDTSRNRHIEVLQQKSMRSSPVVHVAAAGEEDDDSLAQEIDDGPKTITCGGTCRLDALVPLTGLAIAAKVATREAPTQSPHSDSTMIGLSDFVGKANDKVLSYILEQSALGEPRVKGRSQAPSRLAPGMPLPGQLPGFPLQL